jgi:hypothetical protein
MMDGWKVLTHDHRPPIRGGDPVWDGRRKTLDRVKLDTGGKECAAGWNFCREAHDALRLAGLWPDGYPSVLLRVRGGKDTIEQNGTLCSSRLTILGVCSEDKVRDAVRALSGPLGEHADAMVCSQMAWRRALARPHWNEAAVEAGLRAALAARGLTWDVQRHGAPWEAWTTWGYRKAREALAAWEYWVGKASRHAWGVWDAWERDATDVWLSWDPRDVWGRFAAVAAECAGDALAAQFTALVGGTDHDDDPMVLTTGLRDAYGHGLAVAVPVEPCTLGWAMVEKVAR